MGMYFMNGHSVASKPNSRASNLKSEAFDGAGRGNLNKAF